MTRTKESYHEEDKDKAPRDEDTHRSRHRKEDISKYDKEYKRTRYVDSDRYEEGGSSRRRRQDRSRSREDRRSSKKRISSSRHKLKVINLI